MSELWTTVTTEYSCNTCDPFIFSHGLIHQFFEYTIHWGTNNERLSADFKPLTHVFYRTNKQKYNSAGTALVEAGELIIQKPEGYDFLPEQLRKSGIYLSETKHYSTPYYSSCSCNIESTIYNRAVYETQNNDNPNDHVPLDEVLWAEDYSKEFMHPTGGKYRITIPASLKATLTVYTIELPERLPWSRYIYEYNFPYDRYSMIEKLN